jgi:nitrogen-specific signal transduction histidine kinase
MSGKKATLCTSLKGGPPLPSSLALFGGTVFTSKDLVPMLQRAACPFAIIDYCSAKYKGGCDVYYMSQEYADACDWPKPKTSADMEGGEFGTDALKSFQMGVKNKVQYQLEGFSMNKTKKTGEYNFQMTPINYSRLPGETGAVCTLEFASKIGENADKAEQDEALMRGNLCFTFSNEIISLCNPDGVVLHQNDQSKLFFDNIELDGYDVKNGDGTVDILRTILPFEHHKAFEKAVFEDKGTYQIELQIQPDVWHHIQIFSCFDPVDGGFACTVTQTDISEMNKRKNMLFANMSHELKTPLNGIIALAEILTEDMVGKMDGEQRGHMTTILNSGRRLNNLVTNLLDASLLRKKKLSVRCVDDTNLWAIVEDVLAVCRSINKNSNDVKLVNSVEKDQPTFKCDAGRLAQIINNLVNNSIKFTFVGSITVKSMTKDNDDLSNTISIQVRDTGIGIAEENQKKIFESLRQVDEDADRKFGGTGLGLAISRDLAIAMGGDLSLTSKKGVGSTFSCNLPYFRSSKDKEMQRLFDEREVAASNSDQESIEGKSVDGDNEKKSAENDGEKSSMTSISRGSEDTLDQKSHEEPAAQPHEERRGSFYNNNNKELAAVNKENKKKAHRSNNEENKQAMFDLDMFMRSCSDVTGEIEM